MVVVKLKDLNKIYNEIKVSRIIYYGTRFSAVCLILLSLFNKSFILSVLALILYLVSVEYNMKQKLDSIRFENRTLLEGKE